MRKILYLCAIILFSSIAANAQVETYANAWSSKKGNLTVAYLNNYPYAYSNDKGESLFKEYFPERIILLFCELKAVLNSELTKVNSLISSFEK